MTLPYLAVHRSGFGSRSIPARFAPRGSTHKLVPMSSSQSMFLPTITPWPLSFHITRVHTACPRLPCAPFSSPGSQPPPAHRRRLITPGDYAPSSACEPQPALPVQASAGATRSAMAPARSPSAPLPAGDVGAGAPRRGLIAAWLLGASAPNAANAGLVAAVAELVLYGWAAGCAAGLKGKQLAALALAFGVRRRSVTLVTGAVSRTKIVDVDGGEQAVLDRLLAGQR